MMTPEHQGHGQCELVPTTRGDDEDSGEITANGDGDEAPDQRLVRSGSMSSDQVRINNMSALDSSAVGGLLHSMPEPNSMTNLVISTVLGNILEWYDFGIFASFSTELSKAFFTGGRLEEILKVYGVFAVAFFARPLGGFLLGLIGDRYARTLSLQISVISMAASALFISILPTNSYGKYAIGPSATVLLVLARIIQGLSTGGEMVGSMLYMVENVPQNWKCLVSAIPLSSAVTGTALGYFVSTVITATMSEEARTLWGWRLAFAIGVPAGGVGFMFRKYLSESHSFSNASKLFSERHGNQHPFFYGLRMFTLPLCVLSVISILICGFYSGTVWYTEAWLEVFYTELIGDKGLSEFLGRTINTCVLFFGLAGGILLGAAAIDSIPRVPLHVYIVCSAVLMAVTNPLLLWLISRGTDCVACVVLGQICGVVLFIPTVSSLALWLSSQFPPTLQYTSIALSYNVAQALFGGTMPYISTALSTKGLLAPAFYLSGLAVVGAIATIMSRLNAIQGMRKRLHDNM